MQLRRRTAAVAVTALVAVACGGGSQDESSMVQRGQELYDAFCVSCHGGPTGGEISDIPPPHNAEGHTWHHGDCVLADIIRDGPAPRPGAGEEFPAMPAFGDRLSDDDIDAILAYIKTWWEDDQREFQAEMTELNCDRD